MNKNAGNQNDSNNTNRGVNRRSVLGGTIGALVGMVVGSSEKKANAQTRPLVELGGLCDGHMIVLRQEDGIRYLKGQMETSSDFPALVDHFTREGMEFIMERAQVFMYMAETDGPGSTYTPNVIGILPSFVRIDPSAPSHEAVGIVVHQNGKALAGGVVVNHNPFSIMEFSVHDVQTTTDDAGEARSEVISNFIPTELLESSTEDEAARLLTIPREDPETWDPNVATLHDRDRESVAAMAFHTIINDERSRPMYTPEGLESLLSQTPLVQKFASVNYIRYREATAAKAGWCCSTSSSCNATTSTSTSTSVTVNQVKEADPATN